LEGPCVVDATGCVTTPNFPGKYGPNELCTITANPNMLVTAEEFRTERCCDKLTIDGTDYAGYTGPQNVYPWGPITWSSDDSLQDRGWRLCASPGAPPPTPAPVTEPPPYDGPCGVKGADETPWTQIVNGQKATRCEWRWQAQLRSGLSGEGHPFCGGALIDELWVATAAHCIHFETEEDFTVKLNDYNRSQAEANEVNRRVKRIHKHPRYNHATFVNDIALLELTEPVRLTDCVGTVCLPEKSEAVEPGATCWITGWGTLVEGGSQPNTLQEGQVIVQNLQTCNSSYDGQVTTDMVCAQGSRDGEIVDACQGDSGGPMVCDAGNGRYVLQGATSWGAGCANQKFPGLWAGIAHQRDWIRSITGF